jgi:hypothetical protein
MITIETGVGDRDVYLAELLLLVGFRFINAQWYVDTSKLEVAGDSELYSMTDDDMPLSTFELIHFVTPTVQVIDGEFIARLDSDDSDEFSLRIAAIDCTCWDIETKFDDIYDTIRSMYTVICEQP